MTTRSLAATVAKRKLTKPSPILQQLGELQTAQRKAARATIHAAKPLSFREYMRQPVLTDDYEEIDEQA